MPVAASAARRSLLGLPSTTASAASKGAAGDGIFSDSFESPAPPGPGVAILALNRAAYGPRPGDVAAFNALGGSDQARLAAWVEQQLDPGLDDSACTQRIAARGYTTLHKSMAQLWSDHVRDRDNQGLDAYPQRYYPCAETECAKILRATYSRRQLYEVMVDFWHNHFNVLGWEFNIAPLFVHYDRDVIRPRALGNFRAMLEEVAKAPAMLQFLDNRSSRAGGFNENFARELCELHTLGVDNYYPGNDPNQVPRDGANVPLGYCDNDVYEAARALTGWTMADDHWEFPNQPAYDSGEFLYYQDWHDTAGKFFLGSYLLPNGPAMKDGRDVFDILCRHMGTARHISRKLCRRFVSDDPPASLVESTADVWQQHWQAPDQIARVLRHILNSQAFRDSWGGKVKRPWEVFAHALRATGAEIAPAPYADWSPYGNLMSLLQQTGNRPFNWPTPDGYPDVASKWTSVSSLAQTWRLMSRLLELRPPGEPENGSYLCDVVQVTNAALPVAQRSAAAIVDFWIARLFGMSIAPTRRQQAIDFLRQNGTATEALETTANSWSSNNLRRHYTQSRLRAAVSLLLMTPEFHQR